MSGPCLKNMNMNMNMSVSSFCRLVVYVGKFVHCPCREAVGGRLDDVPAHGPPHRSSLTGGERLPLPPQPPHATMARGNPSLKWSLFDMTRTSKSPISSDWFRFDMSIHGRVLITDSTAEGPRPLLHLWNF
jgi:hypothetical protein